jgi:hypothetical protein
MSPLLLLVTLPMMWTARDDDDDDDEDDVHARVKARGSRTTALHDRHTVAKRALTDGEHRLLGVRLARERHRVGGGGAGGGGVQTREREQNAAGHGAAGGDGGGDLRQRSSAAGPLDAQGMLNRRPDDTN